MSPKLQGAFLALVLAIVYVLADPSNLFAFPLDPSEIKVGEIVRMIPTPVKVGGAGGVLWVLKRVVTGYWFADGHTENVDSGKKEGK